MVFSQPHVSNLYRLKTGHFSSVPPFLKPTNGCVSMAVARIVATWPTSGTVDQTTNEATILLVPRLSPNAKNPQGKHLRQPRPNPCPFDPQLSGLQFQHLEDGGVSFKLSTFRGGLLEMVFADDKLRL